MDRQAPLWTKSALAATAAACGIVATLLYVRKHHARAAAVQSTPAGEHGSSSASSGKVFLDGNMPRDAEGRTFHLNVKPGDVANRVLSVGDHGRAERIASLFDSGSGHVVTSSRGFVTHTGTYKGVPVSIIATGMGTPMIDFVVRECRGVVGGAMAMLRYGTCGGLNGTKECTVVVPAQGSIMIRREPDAVGQALGTGAGAAETAAPLGTPTASCPYSVTRPVLPDPSLTSLFSRQLTSLIDGRPCADNPSHHYSVRTGMDATADSFYSSQGRTNKSFADNNESLVHRLETAYPQLCCLQMETFHLLDLARSSRADTNSSIHASAAAIVLVNRDSGSVAGKEDVARLEVLGGKACLETLVAFELKGR